LSFSPDGRALAYARVHDDRSGLAVYDLRSDRTRQLTLGQDDALPVWGPEGIAFIRGCCTDGDLWLVQPDGQGLRRLTSTDAGLFPVAWSADGAQLVAVSPAEGARQMWAVDMRSRGARLLTESNARLFPDAFSRDGSSILAGSGCTSDNPVGELATVPFAGGKATVIARGPCAAVWNR
jgi:TolB protein